MLELEICHLDLVFGEHQFQDAKYRNVTQPEAWSFLGTQSCLPSEVHKGWPGSFWWAA